MPHILIAGKIHQDGLAVIEGAPGVTFDYVSDPDPKAYLPYLPKADGLLLRTQPLTADHIATSNRLSIVSRHGVGYDAVDVAALDARKIPLAIVGDVNSRAVAEHTLMLMLASLRRTVFYDGASRNNWTARNAFDTQELDEKSVLVIGFGRIGRRVAQLVQAFGAKVHAHDPMVKPEDMKALGVTPAPDLKPALADADVVTLHMPGTKGAVIGAEELKLMKASAIIVNAARGGLVDEPALDQALRNRALFAAALDVLVDEPPKPGHPLLGNPHLTISPHTAGLTAECARRMAIVAAQNILDSFAGKLDRALVVNAAAVFG